jgi:hypothetical protein
MVRNAINNNNKISSSSNNWSQEALAHAKEIATETKLHGHADEQVIRFKTRFLATLFKVSF